MITINSEVAGVLALLDLEALALLAARNDLAVSPAVAARLTGRSIPAVRAAVDAAELPAVGRTHRRIAMADLAAWHGRQSFTLEDWAQAFQSAARREAAVAV